MRRNSSIQVKSKQSFETHVNLLQWHIYPTQLGMTVHSHDLSVVYVQMTSSKNDSRFVKVLRKTIVLSYFY